MFDGALRPGWMLFAISGAAFVALGAAAAVLDWVFPFPASLVWGGLAAATGAGLAWSYARRTGREETPADE